MASGISISFDLMYIEMELSTLAQHLKLIEQQLVLSSIEAKNYLERETAELCLDVLEEQAHWDILNQEYQFKVDFILPRTLRNPFLITLYSTYESAVVQIAELMQKKLKQKIVLQDIKGDFLTGSKKYYRYVLNMELSVRNERWQRLRLLSDLRNSVVHANGLIKASKNSGMKKALKHKGVMEKYGYVLVSEEFLRETSEIVESELRSLIKRYQDWKATHPSDSNNQ